MMKTMKSVFRREVFKLTCDKCGFTASNKDIEFHDFFCIDKNVGYDSVFGDGNHVELDLCQYCLKELLGNWIRVRSTPENSKPQDLFFQEEQAEDDIVNERDDVPPGRIGD